MSTGTRVDSEYQRNTVLSIGLSELLYLAHDARESLHILASVLKAGDCRMMLALRRLIATARVWRTQVVA